MKNGWVKPFDDYPKSFKITEQGERYLVDLRRVLEPLYSEEIRYFLRYMDAFYPK